MSDKATRRQPRHRCGPAHAYHVHATRTRMRMRGVHSPVRVHAQPAPVLPMPGMCATMFPNDYRQLAEQGLRVELYDRAAFRAKVLARSRARQSGIIS